MSRVDLPADAIARARQLRRSATDAEYRLWYALRESFPDARFRWQVPFGLYHADFASHRAKLVIEVDGSQHAVEQERDAERTRFLNGEGYKVLRFWNNEVLGNLEGVLAVVANTLSPCGRGWAGRPVPRTGLEAAARPQPAHGEGPVASAAEETPSLEAMSLPQLPKARRSRARA